LHLQQSSTLSQERNMTTRYLIAAALMVSACAAHADVLPGSTPASAGVISGSNVAGVLGNTMIGGVSRGAGGDALVQALYDKVSAAVGNDMKVSLRQGIDGVYVQGLSSAKAVALAGDGMSVINTSEGFKVVQAADAGANGASGSPTSGGGYAVGTPGNTGTITVPATPNANGGSDSGTIVGVDTKTDLNVGIGKGDLGNQANDAAAVPEPSTAFLMLAGMLGVFGLRRRAR
jgi:hypothetical protein